MRNWFQRIFNAYTEACNTANQAGICFIYAGGYTVVWFDPELDDVREHDK